MSKQVRNIIIAVCVVAVLGVATLLLNVLPGKKASTSSSDSSSKTTAISFLSLKTSDIQSLHVQNTSTSYTITKIGTDTYKVDALKDAPADQSEISTRLEEVAGLSGSTLVAQNVSDLSPYGLAKPLATLDATTSDGKTVTVKIGNTTPTGDGHYVLKPGTNDVYITSSFSNYDFSGTALDYASVTLASLSTDAKITRYTLAGASRPKPIQIDVTSSTDSSTSSSSTTYSYKVVQPLSYDANETNAGKITTALQSLSASKVVSVDVSAASLAKYGLTDPAYTLTYTVAGKGTTLSFGNTASDGTVYVISSDKKAIYSVDTTSAAFYNYQTGDLLSTTVYMENIDTLKTMTIQSGSKSHTYTFSGSSDNMVVKEGNTKMNLSSFQNFYQYILSLAARGSADKPSSSSMLTLTFTYNTSKKPDVIQFLPLGTDKAFVEINGTGAMYVYQSDITGLMQLADDVSAGKTVSSPT